MEYRKIFLEFLVATVPAVLIYFVGWGYLYFFLGAFGINIAEIHTDAATIFIYSFPVIRRVISLQAFASADLLWTALTTVAAAVLVVVLWASWVFSKDIQRIEPNPGRIDKFAAAARHLGKLWIGLRWVAVVGLLVIAANVIIPVTESASYVAASRIWDGRATFAIAATPAVAAETEMGAQYDACSKSQALMLIYADDKAYYLLCKNDSTSTQGAVFEVRRTGGLASVRFAARGGALWPKTVVPH